MLVNVKIADNAEFEKLLEEYHQTLYKLKDLAWEISKYGGVVCEVKTQPAENKTGCAE